MALNVLVVSYPIHFHKIILYLLYQVEKIAFVRMYCCPYKHFHDFVCSVLFIAFLHSDIIFLRDRNILKSLSYLELKHVTYHTNVYLYILIFMAGNILKLWYF